MSSGPSKKENANSQAGDKAATGKDDSTAAAGHAAVTSPKKDAGNSGLLEEDDEFEEFPAEDWGPGDEEGGDDPDGVNVWEDNWDDDLVEDDFSKQLRAELHRQGFGAQQLPTIRPDAE